MVSCPLGVLAPSSREGSADASEDTVPTAPIKRLRNEGACPVGSDWEGGKTKEHDCVPSQGPKILSAVPQDRRTAHPAASLPGGGSFPMQPLRESLLTAYIARPQILHIFLKKHIY